MPAPTTLRESIQKRLRAIITTANEAMNAVDRGREEVLELADDVLWEIEGDVDDVYYLLDGTDLPAIREAGGTHRFLLPESEAKKKRRLARKK